MKISPIFLFSWIFRRLVFGLTLLNPLLKTSAQETADISPYLLDSFVEGTLFYKSSPPRNAKLNYHLVGQEIVMDFNQKMVPVNNFPNLDSVTFRGMTFILEENKSYRQLLHGPCKLLLEYKFTSQIAPNEGAYGTKSHAASVVVADQRIKPNEFYSMKWNEGYELVNRNLYWIVQGQTWSSFDNVSQLGQIFKEKKKELKEFMASEKISFSKEEDVIRTVHFLASL